MLNSAPCAKAGVASSSAANDINRYCSFFIVTPSPVRYAASGWLMLTVLAPSRSRRCCHCEEGVPSQQTQIKLSSVSLGSEASMLMRHCQREVDCGQQEEHKRLHDSNAKVQPHKDQRDPNRDQREERQRHQVARKHV